MLEHNVKDFGAVGNGFADDTAAIQNAEDARITSGGIVYFPPGTYLINSPITIHDWAQWVGHPIIPYAIDWRNDWCKRLPTYHNFASVIQYAPALHGSICRPWAPRRVHASFDGLTFRSGQSRTDADVAFGDPMRKAEILRCRFENLHAVCPMPIESNIYTVRFHHNRVIGCHVALDGEIYDSSIQANCFTSVACALWARTGAALRVVGNRMEWCDYGVIAYNLRDSYFTGNEWDSCKSVGVKMQKVKNLAFTGNLYKRSGKAMAVGKRSHLWLGNDTAGVTFCGNSFSRAGDDRTGENQRPAHIIETNGMNRSRVFWSGNDTYDACLKEPIIDRWNNAADWLDADVFECRSEYYDRFFETLRRAELLGSECRVRGY